MSWYPFAVLHLLLAAAWFGSMAYSLAVVQPRVARFFADDQQREEFQTVLAHGNRWPVVALVAGLVGTGAAAATLATGAVTAGFVAALGAQLVAATIFGNVSWRHWPARVFALPAERAGFRRRLRWQAWAMLTLVGASFVLTLVVSVAAERG